MIQLTGISKIYQMGQVQVVALNDIHIHIERREFLSIMGPSGSGKSTMLHILGGLDTPSGGTYHLEDTDVNTLSSRELARIRNEHFGFIFQTFNLLSDFNALENVTMPMIFAQKPPKERRERAAYLLEVVGLQDRMGHFPNQLSGGEQQRVSIARALANEPTVIFADEPTGNLNTKQGSEIMELLKRFNQEGVTVIMVTHSPEISRHAGRLVELADGTIVTDQKKEPAKEKSG